LMLELMNPYFLEGLGSPPFEGFFLGALPTFPLLGTSVPGFSSRSRDGFDLKSEFGCSESVSAKLIRVLETNVRYVSPLAGLGPFDASGRPLHAAG
jgi:hypothetical protein